ncbi:MAG: peptidoglycan-binding protein [Pseudomonadota bacterium]
MSAIVRLVSCICLLAFSVAACVPYSASFPQRVAQPDTPPARNFTSFSASLRCMDDLLASANRPRVLISSTGIPDLTSKIKVSGDDMLVNAISSMNRQSGAYVFVDQSLEKDAGQISIFTPGTSGASPKLYIRGSISQVDTPTDTNLDADGTDQTGTRRLSPVSISVDRGVSIVSVDMHLVNFPDKTVVPGSSVANSMVVTGRGIGLGATGLIDMVSLKSVLQIDRIESMGQAVRNLIELGAIELIGRHANVQYWECLNIPSVNTKAQERKETVFSSGDKLRRIPEAQKMLAQLGYFSGEVTGVIDQRTRDALSHFQAKHRLIATGDLNYDTFQHLQEQTRGYAPKRRVADNSSQFEAPPSHTLIITEVPKQVTPATAQPEDSTDTNVLTQRPQKKASRSGGVLALFGHSTAQQTDIVSMRAQSRKHKIGDKMVVDITSTVSGYLTCFHQSQDGPITQIFPEDPNTAFAINADDPVSVPDASAGFDIVIETANRPEKILCVLERSNAPADISHFVAKAALQPVKLNSFTALKARFKRANRHVHFAEIDVTAR